MTIWTTRGVGQYAAVAEPAGGHYALMPKNYRPDGSSRGVIWCHGATYDEMSIANASFPNSVALFRAIAERYAILGCTFGGDAWGNDTAIARVSDAKTYLQGTLGAASGSVIVMGSSMGGATAMAWARANPSLVACLVLFVPVSDLNDIVSNNRGGLAGSVNTAYGGAYNNGTHGPTHNPAVFAASLAGIPTQIWYATDDAVCVSATVSAVGSAIGAEMHTLTGGHDDAAYAGISSAAVLAFLEAND